MGLTWLAVGTVLAAPSAGWARLSPGTAGGGVVPEQADIAGTAARLDALHLLISGNRAQRRASELLSYHQIEGGTKACMRAAGKPYRVPPFVSRYDDFTDADLGYGTGGGSVVDSVTSRGRRVILNELAGARYDRAGVFTWFDSMPAADVTAFNRCRAPYQYRTYPDFEPPVGTYRLSGFGDLMAPISRNPALIAAMRPYRSCMKQRYGYDVPDRSDFLFKPRISYRDAPVAGRPVPAAWTRGVREIRAVFAADGACRLPAYRIAMRLLAPRLGPWQRRHRAEINAIHAAWQQRVAQARPLAKTFGEGV